MGRVRHFLGFAEDSDARVLFVGAVIGLIAMSTSLRELEKGRARANSRRHSPARLLAAMAHRKVLS